MYSCTRLYSGTHLLAIGWVPEYTIAGGYTPARFMCVTVAFERKHQKIHLFVPSRFKLELPDPEPDDIPMFYLDLMSDLPLFLTGTFVSYSVSISLLIHCLFVCSFVCSFFYLLQNGPLRAKQINVAQFWQ